MKRILSFMLVFFFVGTSVASENPWDKKLPFKSATVKYKVDGSMKGEKTLYIKDYGRTTAEYSTMTMKMFGMTQDQKEIIITTPEWVYSADLVENTGTKQANMRKLMQDEFNNLSSADQKKVIKNSEELGISTIEGMDGSLEKNAATILGYTCDKVTLMGTTAYNISGSEVPMKIQGDTMGIKIHQQATDITTSSVPTSRFNLPQGINFVNDPATDQMMRDQAKTMMQNLVEGKSPMAGSMPQAPAGDSSYSQAEQVSHQGSQSSNDYGLGQDAKDVGQAARQEAKDNTIEEVQEGVKSLFKSMFD